MGLLAQVKIVECYASPKHVLRMGYTYIDSLIAVGNYGMGCVKKQNGNKKELLSELTIDPIVGKVENKLNNT